MMSLFLDHAVLVLKLHGLLLFIYLFSPLKHLHIVVVMIDCTYDCYIKCNFFFSEFAGNIRVLDKYDKTTTIVTENVKFCVPS